MYGYIHIPFCTSRCSYCRFATFANFDDLKVSFYVDYLCNDILKRKKEKKQILSSLYFWGGTPSILSNKYLEKIFSSLKEVFEFSSDIEITLESTPQNITKTNIISWEKLWINRVSVWVQSLNNQVLKEIGRISSDEIFQALEILSQSSIQTKAVDFILGLPYTKRGDVGRDISFIVDKYPEINHISVYMLEEYTYPKSWEKHAFSESDFNEEYLHTKAIIEQLWFYRYEVSNYAKWWYECHHNKAYWNHSEMLAFWLGAHGFENGRRYSFPTNFSEYYTGKILWENPLNDDEKRIEKIMFWIRTTGFSENLVQTEQKKKLAEFLQEGFLEKTGNVITLSNKWVSVMDTILSEII